MKKILIVFFILFSFAYSEIDFEELIFSTIKNRLNVGLKSFHGDTIFIKVTNGNAVIEYDNEMELALEGTVLKIEYKNKKLLYNSSIVDDIRINREDVITILGVSNDGENYRRFRGDISFKEYEGKLLPVNNVNVEEYLYSVVPSEIGNNFPDEAIKAQALAARTYLYFSLKQKKYGFFDLFDNTNSQMYLGYEKENPKINKLIDETEGEIITYKDEPINALYHSTSGGKTANNEDVWGGVKVPYLRSINDNKNFYKSPRAKWSSKISKSELSQKVGFKVTKVSILSKKNDRVHQVIIDGEKRKIVSGNEFRKIVGYTKIFSTIFSVKTSSKDFSFYGKGSGHGVGLSQWGAYGLAEKGYNYVKILKYYYRGVEIQSLKNVKNVL